MLKKKILLLVNFILLITLLKAQNSDLKVAIHQNMLNKLLLSIGEIKGTSEYSFMLIKGEYQWSLINPQINIHPDRVEFVTNVNVKIGKLSYTNKVVGKMEVCYEPSTNLIYLELVNADYPLNIMFLGKERHITDVSLKKYFETPFTFEGPLTTTSEMKFELPDKTIKTIYAHPVNCGVKITEGLIVVSAELEFLSNPLIPSKKN